tara:strand:- start:635 stop:2671 length:2037 start_codon:yes stop_codon:yes gene_type:complete
MGKSLQGGRLVSNSRIFVDSGGNIGIGSTQPTSKLDIAGDVRITGISTLSNVTVGDATFSGITTFHGAIGVAAGATIGGSTNTITASTNGEERLRIDSSGDIEIAQGKNLTWVYEGGSTHRARIRAESTDALIFENGSGNAEQLRITSAGLIGIGTDNPAYQVDIVGDAGLSVSALTNSTHGQLSIVGRNSNGGVSAISRLKSYPDGSSNQSHFAIETRNSSNTMVEALRIDSSARLLVGTTTEGNAIADTLTLAESGSGGITIRTGTTSEGNIAFSDGTSGADEYRGLIRYNHETNLLSFWTNSTERLRITSTGLLLGGSDSEYNTTLGENAGDSFTGTALYNTLIGQDAGTAITTADTNTAVGAYALATATTASMSCAFGYAALRNTNAWYNNAFGKDALENCTTGSSNNAFGYLAMESHTTGSNNCAFGHEALMTNTTSWSNSAFGAHALRSNTGASNTAVGRNAMYTNTSGYQNTAVGRDSFYKNTSGINNNALGFRALYNNTTGNDNVAIGRDAGYFNTTGSGNISIGICNSSGTYAPVFGLSTSNNRVVMGSTAVTNAYVQVAWTVVSDARDKMNFGTVPHGLEFIKQLNPVSFQFRFTRDSDTPNGPVRYGFKAQDILALEGEDNAVIIDNDDPDKLRYNGEALVPVLVNAIKEQQVIIDALLARLDAAGI